MKEPELHYHAKQRLQDRFGVDDELIIENIKSGKALRLPGTGYNKDAEKVRSAHLLYLPEIHEYCVVVMDDRVRLGITVLTEEMALESTWAFGITDASRLRAKKRALRDKGDSVYLQEYTRIKGALEVNVRLRCYDMNWNLKVIRLNRISISPDQIDTAKELCRLTNNQLETARREVQKKIDEKQIRPFGELHIAHTNQKKSLRVSNPVPALGSLENGAIRLRWLGDESEPD